MTHIDKWIHMALLCMDSWIPLEDLEATHHDSSERMTKMFTDWIGLVLIEHHTHQKSIEKPKKKLGEKAPASTEWSNHKEGDVSLCLNIVN